MPAKSDPLGDTGRTATAHRTPQAPSHRWRRLSSPARGPDTNTALQVRRTVYRRRLYSLHVGANPVSRFAPRPPTPADFVADAELLRRAKTFVRRELRVFGFLVNDAEETRSLNGAGEDSAEPPAGSTLSARGTRPGGHAPTNAEFLLAYLAAILQTVDLQDSAGRAEELLAEFLGRQHAALFLHELRAWLRSPYENLAAWDRHVQYEEDPTTNSTAAGYDQGENNGHSRDRDLRKRSTMSGDASGQGRGAAKKRRVYDSYVPSY